MQCTTFPILQPNQTNLVLGLHKLFSFISICEEFKGNSLKILENEDI